MTNHSDTPSFTHAWLLPVVVSVVVAEIIAVAAGMLLKGAVSMEYMLAGLVAALLVAGVSGTLLNRQKQPAADRQARTAPTKPPQAAAAPTQPMPPAPAPAQEIKQSLDFAAQKAPAAPAAATSGRTNLRLAISHLESLPAMPAIAQKLLALKLDTEAGQREMLLLVEQDPQISAKILGLANSAAVASSRQIRTIKEATMMLGFKRVQLTTVSIALLSVMAKKTTKELNMENLWLHGFHVTSALQALAKLMPEQVRPQDDETFLAGMLHDIGYMALAFLDPRLSDRLHNYLSAEPERPSLEIERELVDICHDELGAELARHWKLPENLVAVLRFHHTPDAADAQAGQPLARMINIAEKLLPQYGIIEYVPRGVSAEEWQALGIDPDNAEEVSAKVMEHAEHMLQFAGAFA